MKVKDLYKTLEDMPQDAEICISVDTSTGGHDFGQRTFGEDFEDWQEDCNGVTLMFSGYHN